MRKLFVSLIAVLMTVMFTRAQNSPDDFYGMWTLDIEGGSVGWLHVFENNGFLDAELLWRGGSVTPVAHVFLMDNNTLVVSRTREVKRTGNDGKERNMAAPHLFKITRSGDKLEGVSVQPSNDGMEATQLKFSGWKLPDVPPSPDLSKLKFGKPVKLFNGKDLSGWELINPKQTNGFKAVDGILVNDPVKKEGEHISYGNLRTKEEFEDFNLTLEVNVPKGSNSGVYLRGMYEIQVLDSYGKETDSHNMGALYSRITPSVAAEKPAGEWQTMDITLCDRHVTVKLNGVTVINNQPAYGPTGGAIKADVFAPGPIYLQGDHGKVLYRNFVLTPISK
ncbi:3-keto-disaccharide hydrolase [Mariniphaga sediminis]|uniref:3-keto-disaccharide hydrolase n=1 Tax=Mariniphaga sediminis TaxID=1628158 RepID=UPI003569B543